MTGVAFVLAGWFVGRVIYDYVHHFAFRLSQEIHAAYIEIYPENPPHFAPEKAILTPIQSKIFRLVICPLRLAKRRHSHGDLLGVFL